jgi:hypothetical protein
MSGTGGPFGNVTGLVTEAKNLLALGTALPEAGMQSIERLSYLTTMIRRIDNISSRLTAAGVPMSGTLMTRLTQNRTALYGNLQTTLEAGNWMLLRITATGLRLRAISPDLPTYPPAVRVVVQQQQQQQQQAQHWGGGGGGGGLRNPNIHTITHPRPLGNTAYIEFVVSNDHPPTFITFERRDGGWVAISQSDTRPIGIHQATGQQINQITLLNAAQIRPYVQQFVNAYSCLNTVDDAARQGGWDISGNAPVRVHGSLGNMTLADATALKTQSTTIRTFISEMSDFLTDH